MKNPVLKTEKSVTLLGGGQVDRETLVDILKSAPILVAADGAADRALAEGLMPEAVIGDFDSVSQDARGVIPPERLHHIPEQDSTDFEKCLSRIDAPLIFGVGFTGARVDHELAVYTALMRHPKQRCIIVGEFDVIAHVPSSISLTLAPGTRVSLFPMGPVTGRSEGLRWPIEGLHFAPAGRVGTSNEASEAQVHLAFDGPGMLLILPRSDLAALVQGLAFDA